MVCGIGWANILIPRQRQHDPRKEIDMHSWHLYEAKKNGPVGSFWAILPTKFRKPDAFWRKSFIQSNVGRLPSPPSNPRGIECVYQAVKKVPVLAAVSACQIPHRG